MRENRELRHAPVFAGLTCDIRRLTSVLRDLILCGGARE
jgi:hypothetical protein